MEKRNEEKIIQKLSDFKERLVKIQILRPLTVYMLSSFSFLNSSAFSATKQSNTMKTPMIYKLPIENYKDPSSEVNNISIQKDIIERTKILLSLALPLPPSLTLSLSLSLSLTYASCNETENFQWKENQVLDKTHRIVNTFSTASSLK